MSEGNSRPWLAHYPPGVPGNYQPVHDSALAMFKSTVAVARDAEAIAYFDGSISYAELDAMSDALAVWLFDRGLRKGDRVGIILQNVPHIAIAILASWKVGAVPVPSNPMYRAAELAKLFMDYQPAAIIAHDDHQAEVTAGLALAERPETLRLSVSARDFQTRNDVRLIPPARSASLAQIDDFGTALATCDGCIPPEIALEGADLALILYTSGTTGVPKGAMIRHSSVVFNSGASALWMRVGPSSRILGLAPIFHITGFILHLTLAWSVGASVALHYRFHAEAVLDIIREYRPTFAMAAITAFNALMQVPEADHSDFESLETVFSGGAPIAPMLLAKLKARLGIAILPAYGMTETSSPTHLAPPGVEVPVSVETGALSVGLPMPSTQAMICDPDGNPLPPGEHGEVCMRGPQVMAGYWNKPEETSQCLVDGWMHSGDIGFQDENGWFYVVDRSKDMINASGFKVWPREVEDALYAHPAVREAAVVGVPDAYRGETVRAYLSLKAPADEEALIAHCRLNLAAYKVPRSIVFLDELPKTLSGKIQRAALREVQA